MPRPTDPPIFAAENTADARRLVAAQARMYSDAKRLFHGRIAVVATIAIAVIATSANWPDSRVVLGGGGGLLLFVGSFIIETVEKRRRLQAAATQELFDTRIFQIEWNSLQAIRPPSIEIARAAARYNDGRDVNWYDDTGQTVRPFDILICQASNLGWGSTMHRIWGWILSAGLAATFAIIGLLWYIFGLSLNDALLVFLVPMLAPSKEIATLIRTNFEAARSKESTEANLNTLWEKGMIEMHIPTDQNIRSLQDRILIMRQSNSYVPDWLDGLFHARNEAAMRASVQDRVEQARRHGHV